jgi:hypothetical protein
MASTRLIIALLAISGILTLLVLVYFYLQVPHHQAPFGRALDGAQQITLRIGSSKVQLDKEGTTWKVSSGAAGPFPADSGKVKSLLDGLRNVQAEDEISNNPQRAADFQVNAASGVDVAIFKPGGTLLAEGIFGKQAPDFNHIYFKFPNKPSVYLARGIIRGELGEPDLNSWRSHQLLDIPDEQIRAIFIEGHGFKTPLVRSSDTWSANGEKLNAAPVWGLVGMLAHLHVDDFVDLSQHPALAAARLTYASVVVQTTTGNHQLHFGAPDTKDKRTPVSVDQEPSVGWISESTAGAVLRKLSDFQIKK